MRKDVVHAGDKEGIQRGDYFVPWHIPLHRVEAAAAAAKTLAAPQADSAEGPGTQKAINRRGQHVVSSPPPESGNGLGCSVSDAGSGMADAAEICIGVGRAGISAEGAFADGRIDRAKGTVVFKRYYHLFDEGELNSLVLQVPGVSISDSFYDKSNWCVIYGRTA